MSKHIVEVIVGALVVLVAVSFAVYLYNYSSLATSSDSYKVYANFDRADGLKVGSEVRVSGINIGKISAQHIDAKKYQAVIELSIDSKIKLPLDTSAEIIGDGLLGGKYIALLPGADEEFLAAGDYIEYTQSSVSIERLIGKFVFGSSDKEKE